MIPTVHISSHVQILINTVFYSKPRHFFRLEIESATEIFSIFAEFLGANCIVVPQKCHRRWRIKGHIRLRRTVPEPIKISNLIGQIFE